MDKYDHAQVRPALLTIITPTFLAHGTDLRSMCTVPTFQLLTIPHASADNFGTSIRISMCQPPLTVYLKGVQIQEGRDVQHP
jgi:hypothetical protein